jgi:sialic acid synthase SpsE
MDPAENVAPIPFGTREIGPGISVVIIAEIGINHEGSVDACARMIDQAAGAGADAIKLQTINADENYVAGTESHDLFSGAALTQEETARMFELSRELGLEPFTTCGDPVTLAWVDRLEPAAHKISSGLLTHLPLIRIAAKTGRSLVVSTGMAEAEEIDDAVEACGSAAFVLLQCTSIYPAPPETLDLANLGVLNARYGVPVGFSDHTDGVDAAPLAVAAGARVIEKHFTLDRKRPSFDHQLSLEPNEFAEMVARIRAAESMMGHADVRSAQVSDNRRKLLRCLVARRPISAGEKLTIDNLGVKRPLPDRRGLAPKHFDEVLGHQARQDLAIDDPITHEALVDLT